MIVWTGSKSTACLYQAELTRLCPSEWRGLLSAYRNMCCSSSSDMIESITIECITYLSSPNILPSINVQPESRRSSSVLKPKYPTSTDFTLSFSEASTRFPPTQTFLLTSSFTTAKTNMSTYHIQPVDNRVQGRLALVTGARYASLFRITGW